MKRLGAYPLSFRFFGAAALWAALQVFPATNGYFYTQGAPYWVTVLINLGFLAMAREAFAGVLSAAWLLGPILWFGGYGILTWRSHHEADVLAAQVEAFNAGKRLPFDPTRQALVIERGDIVESLSSELTQAFDLPAAYEPNPGLTMARHIATRLGAGDVCGRLRSDQRYEAAYIRVFSLFEGEAGEKRKPVRGMCQIDMPQDPVLPVVTLSATTRHASSALLDYTIDTRSLHDAQTGAAVAVQTAAAAPLSWWPLMKIGCFPEDLAMRWNCFAEFDREPMRALGRDAVSLVADTLGLARAPASSRSDKVAALPDPGFDRIVHARERESLSVLDRVLRDDREQTGAFRTDSLIENPGLYARRAPELVEALRRRMAEPRRDNSQITSLEMLIAALPQDAFRKLGAPILAALDLARETTRHNVDRRLVERLADLGVAALPTLERLAYEQRRSRDASAIYALCRIGPPAASAADTIAARLAETGRRSEVHKVAYIALLRLGRRDLLTQDRDPQSRYARSRYDHWAATVSPDSPPDVCDPRSPPRR